MPKVTLVPGDGIGPELVAVTVQVLAAAGADINWEEVECGSEAFKKHGSAIPDKVVEILQRNKVALKGPITVPPSGYPSPNQGLRTVLRTYANVRSARYYPPGGRSRYPGFGITIVRDAVEDLGRGVQQVIDEGESGIAIKYITRKGSERIARYAFLWAQEKGFTRITVPNQAPSLRTTDGLFLRAAEQVAKEYPGITLDEEAMDALCMRLAIDPTGYRILLTPNFYGGILCGLISGLAGSVGLMGGALFGDETALFEPGHGSAPKYAGLNKTNPTATILSGAMLLDFLGQDDAAARVRNAVEATILENKHVTYDLGGTAGTKEMAAAIAAQLR